MFSYRSREPESVAFTQLGYATPRIANLLSRYAREFVATEEAQAHLRARPPG